MYSAIVQRILYPIGEAFFGTTMLRYLKELEESQWWSPNELRELQNKKLRALVEHAYANVPYYRRIFQERGLTGKDIQTTEDLRKLPILTKNNIRMNFDDLKATDFSKWKPYLGSTSGSSGEPLQYYTSMDCFSMGWASTFRAWEWAGYKLGDKRVTFGGTSLVPANISLINKLRYLAERNLPLSSLGMSDNIMATYVDKVKRFKPRYIRGYPSAIATLAKYASERDITGIRPQAIFTTAESLLPAQRNLVESTFKCDVFDQYGLNDGGAMILECPTHEGYHIMAEKALVEIIKGGEKTTRGEEGEIITTDLYNYAMPFIRYATGDLAVTTDMKCSCGRGLPLVKSIKGRIINAIVLKNGNRISGLPLTDIFEHIEGRQRQSFEQYQIVQRDFGRIIVKIVKDINYQEENTSIITREFKKHLGQDMNIEIELVDNIPVTEAGKRVFVINEIDA